MSNKIYNEQGFLTEEGQDLFSKTLNKSVDKILSFASNDNELRILGAAISKRVADLVSAKIQENYESNKKMIVPPMRALPKFVTK